MLQNVAEVDDPADLYNKLMNLLLKFAGHGVIHGDYNEFNIMLDDLGTLSSSTSRRWCPQLIRTREYFFIAMSTNCIRELIMKVNLQQHFMMSRGLMRWTLRSLLVESPNKWRRN